MDLGLRDKVCVVTGSTGGIGLETARLLAAEGAVVVTSRPARGRAIGDLHVAADLVPARRARARDRARRVERFGRVDCLVNNVGFAEIRRFEELTEEQTGSAPGS